jgi:CheY-like chemotaxis protein
LSDALIFGLGVLVLVLIVVLILAFRFPAGFEAFVGSITQAEIKFTGVKIRRAATAVRQAEKAKQVSTRGPSPDALLRLLAAPPRILWVDDHPEGNQYELSMLRALGMQVDTARSNSEAVQIATSARPDLVVSDIRRDTEGPKAGLQLFEELNNAGVDTDIVYYTGRATSMTTDFGAPVTDTPIELLALVTERLVPNVRQRLVRSMVC